MNFAAIAPAFLYRALHSLRHTWPFIVTACVAALSYEAIMSFVPPPPTMAKSRVFNADLCIYNNSERWTFSSSDDWCRLIKPAGDTMLKDLLDDSETPVIGRYCVQDKLCEPIDSCVDHYGVEIEIE